MKLSIISPWYKSPQSVFPLYERCVKATKEIADFDEIEFVFVDDHSCDDTWPQLSALARQDSRVKAIKFSRNFGQYFAITAGLDHCTGDWAVVLDCDLQDPPEDIPKLWEMAKTGFDMVCARRCNRKDATLKKFSSYAFFKVFNWASGLNYDGSVGTFRILSRKVIDSYLEMRETTRHLGSQLKWLGFDVGYVDIEHAERFAGKSTYSFARLLKLATDQILAYSNRPLLLSVKLGFSITVLSICMALWGVVLKLFWGVEISGWASLIVSLWFIGGVIIANLGLLGVYISKIYDEVKHRPLYVVAERINVD